MDIKTKFNIGERVFFPYSETTMEETICPACKGKKTIEIDGNKFTCASCIDGTITKFRTNFIVRNSKIGLINTTTNKDSITETNYMLAATGIGSGALWKEHEIFATKEECLKYISEQDEKHE